MTERANILSMEEYEKRIAELSDLVGIIPEYYDIFGKLHTVSKESRAGILSAMDLQVGTTEEIDQEIERKKLRQWQRMLDPVTVISVHAQPHRLAVHLPMPEGREQAAEITLTVEDEQGKKESVHYASARPAGRSSN